MAGCPTCPAFLGRQCDESGCEEMALVLYSLGQEKESFRRGASTGFGSLLSPDETAFTFGHAASFPRHAQSP